MTLNEIITYAVAGVAALTVLCLVAGCAIAPLLERQPEGTASLWMDDRHD